MIPKPPKRGPKPPKRIQRGPRPQGRTKPAKVRKTTLAALKRRLWNLFRDYVKERDGNTCFTCGKEGLVGQGWHAGHFITAGQHAVIRWEPKNVHSQCFTCNINLRGNGGAYAIQFSKVYGMEEMARLYSKSREVKKWTEPEVRELIEALEKGGADYECLYAEKYGL